MAYNDPQPPSYSAPPPMDSPPAEGRSDNYGWQGQTPNPSQPYQTYQPSQPSQQTYQQPYQPYAQPGQPNYAGPMAPGTSGYAIASLICALLGYIGFPVVGGILGIIFGHLAIREIDRSNGMLQGRGIAQAGLILSYIHFGLIALVILFVIIFVVIGVGAATLAPNS
jgi:Domain of unknown function (DUF4190)